MHAHTYVYIHACVFEHMYIRVLLVNHKLCFHVYFTPPSDWTAVTQTGQYHTCLSVTSYRCMTSHPVDQCLVLLQGSSPADCSHLPPEQRRKKLQMRINNINQEIQREREQRYVFYICIDVCVYTCIYVCMCMYQRLCEDDSFHMRNVL